MRRSATKTPQEFEWDEDKAEANLRKHGVSFEEAAESFADPLGMVHPVREHGDARFLLLAKSPRDRILYTVHAERDGDVIRIISSRKATKREERLYEEGSD